MTLRVIPKVAVYRNQQKGFTLLEVLLSGFILFLVLSSMTLVYRGALLSSSKAEKSVVISSSVLPIRRLVSDKVRHGMPLRELAGDGAFGKVSYSWRAILAATGKPSALTIENSGEELEYFLWHVDLYLQQGKVTRTYRFSEISW